MPDISVEDVLLDPDFCGCPAQNPDDGITVQRRLEIVDNHGRVSWQITAYQGVVASVIAVGDNMDQSLTRGPDEMHVAASIEVHTKFMIQEPSPGVAPDRVIWNGTLFQVTKVLNHSRYGAGFVQANCTSVDFLDQPPRGDDAGGIEAPAEPDLSGGGS